MSRTDGSTALALGGAAGATAHALGYPWAAWALFSVACWWLLGLRALDLVHELIERRASRSPERPPASRPPSPGPVTLLSPRATHAPRCAAHRLAWCMLCRREALRAAAQDTEPTIAARSPVEPGALSTTIAGQR